MLGYRAGFMDSEGTKYTYIPFHAPSVPLSALDITAQKTYQSYDVQRSFSVSPAILHGSLARRTILSRERRNNHFTCTWVLKHMRVLREGGVVRFEKPGVLGCDSGV
jgi:hypothetical protein